MTRRFNNPSNLRRESGSDSFLDDLAPSIRKALEVSHERLDGLGIPHVLIGGNAVVAHGHVVTTDDVDWLVGDEILDPDTSTKLVFVFAHGVPVVVGSVGLDYLSPESAQKEAGEGAVKELHRVIQTTKGKPGLHIVQIEHLFLLKLVAWRAKDQLVLTELVRRGVDVDLIREFLVRVSSSKICGRFEQLLRKART